MSDYAQDRRRMRQLINKLVPEAWRWDSHPQEGSGNCITKPVPPRSSIAESVVANFDYCGPENEACELVVLLARHARRLMRMEARPHVRCSRGDPYEAQPVRAKVGTVPATVHLPLGQVAPVAAGEHTWFITEPGAGPQSGRVTEWRDGMLFIERL